KLVEGVIVKGISTDFDWTSFKKWMIEGDTITFLPDKKSNDIVLSKTLADKLNLSLGDKFRMYFIQKPIRQRQFKIAGIYSSGLDLFDKNFIIGDLRHIQKISDWDSTEIGGFDVQLEKFEDLEKIDDLLYGKIDYDLNTTKITDKHREIFGWLDLLDMNVYVVLLFAILVAAINMITALLIIIIEKTNMIGILKALGATNNSIQKIFLYKAANLISKGLLWGNLIGIGLAFIQWKFQLIKLQVETYYISYVPINLDFKHIILLNLGTFVICLLMLILPSMLITSI
ncbi:MAG: FtsX-like permease family protein, partial [Flavobacteriales bacterium]|nr:FtsX-like permease family protein [Flavobacteriales bacterium]